MEDLKQTLRLAAPLVPDTMSPELAGATFAQLVRRHRGCLAPVEMVPVGSSNLRSVGYHVDSGIMTVEFNSGLRWRYFDVPPETHAALMSADSVGKYFNSFRGAFDSERVEEKDESDGND